MATVPEELHHRLQDYQQVHVLDFWEKLSAHQQQQLIDQLQTIDLELIQSLTRQGSDAFELPPVDRIAPVPAARLSESREEKFAGERSLRQGEVAVIVVAGGQGSRLGFERPKGMYPIGPVSRKSLFQIHVEKVLALRRRYLKAVPLLVMTSDTTHDDTLAFFDDHQYFGLPPDEVVFFQQGTMPAVDQNTGQLLMEAPGRLFSGPNGHGGTLLALAETGLLDQLNRQGIKQVFYFQVDNPLIKAADPAFLGHHLALNAEVSSKVVPKLGPTDKLGNLVLVDGRCTIIEYSDLPEDLARQTDDEGKLRFGAGSPAIHIFSVQFLERITRGESLLPYHVARKKVPHIDGQGNPVTPDKENAFKFEMFIFDALPLADRWAVVETSREDEFEPLKNATGADSPESVQRAMSNRAARWLEKAGVAVPRDERGNAAVPLEISPLFALDAEELARKVDRSMKIEGPTYLG